MELRYSLPGLSCADCAAKLERKLGALSGVESATINFFARTLDVRLNGRGGQTEQDILSLLNDWETKPVVLSQEKPSTGKRDHAQPDRRLLRLGAALLLFALSYIPALPDGARLALNMAAFLTAGADVLFRAGKNLVSGRLMDENFLMSIASLGAISIGKASEAAAVMLFYQVGEYFQDRAVDRSRRDIAALMDIRPDTASVLSGGEFVTVPPEQVAVGALVLVRPGERVPLDGEVLSGDSSLDTGALTGESRPRDVHPGFALLAGSINLTGPLTIRVTKTAGESTVAKILRLMEESGAAKAPSEQFITRFSRVYTPVVVLLAVLLAVLPPLLLGGGWAQWLNRSLVLLVISCPCALVISIPLSFFGGIGGASRKGILFKGGNYMEALSRADTVVLDKTGTLTTGSLRVSSILPSPGFENLLELAARAERHSTHPLAAAIGAAAGRVPPGGVESIVELAGFGVSAVVDGRTVLAGNRKLMERAGLRDADGEKTAVHVAVGGEYAGRIEFEDELKPDSPEALRRLKELGVRRTVLLTGDHETAARSLARALTIDEVHAGLLPDEKVARVEALEKELPAGRTLVFMGDGINDAPVLARAGVGVAMGGIGSDAAIEAANVVLLSDEPSKLAEAIVLARRTRRIVTQNIVFALGVKGVILILGALGYADIWPAVFADVGVTFLAVLNAIRALRVR